MSNSIVGAKKKERKPRIAVDSAASISTAKLLYGLAEGEVYGLADGAKSIRLDGTPLVDDNGNGNFNGVRWTFAAGTNDQEHISGFPDVTNEIGVGVELKSSQPWIKAFNDTQLSAVRVRFKWGRLSKTNPDNGDVNGHTIKYAIDLQTDGGAYHEIINTKIQEKTSAGYERTHRIDLPKAKTGWQLRVRRLTPNDPSEYVQDTMMIEAVAEVIDVKLSYPNTALLGIEYNAEIFSSVAKISVRVKGKIIRVPDNYDPVARTYTGIWTGNFKDAYSNNPAWIFYDLCTQWRGGLGERLDATMIDRWSLYALGQYCDQPVSDGQGGLEPRFTCNVYLQKQEEAYTVLQNIAGIFRAMSFWTGERIMLDADVPQDPIYTYSSANIVGGVAGIQYSGTRNRDRHTLAKVAWDNPNNDYQTEYEYVRDEKAMSKFGVKVLDLSAFGCTSQAQAQRAGLWALKTEQLETRQVTFSVGLDGAIPTVGNIISLSDEAFAGRANGGRVSTVNGTQRIIELDREVVASVGDVLIINGGSGKSERRNISNVVGNRITVTAPFTSAEPEHVWAIETADLKLMRFRVMSITENDDATYAITAIQHEPQKYDAIDFGTDVKPTEITIINPDTVDAPASVTVTSRHREVQGQTVTTLIISWSQVKGAVAYDVEWRKDDGTWIKLPRTGNVSAEIDGVYSGNYMARVRAISAFDVQSQATTSALTAIEGKIGLPPTVVGLTATGVLFGMDLKWGFQAGSGDAAYTEIQVGSAPNVNVATLGQYSYPTNTHTITGLQGNLKQSYRARLVDKLGFKSPWSAWVTGTTDANANKIMDLIEGQITESHLYQELTDKIDKVDKIEPLELLVGDETKGLVKAIADERDARIDAIGTSALEGSESLHGRADALAGTVNGITEWQDVVDTDIEKGFAKMTYLASELDFGYADKTQHASTARGTAWTFAKTVARADYVNSELARGLTADLAGAKASFTEQITATATKNFAATQKIENLSAQVVGGYEGNDLGALSSGLLYQESTARASDYSALAEQISLLSAGVGEQFDPYQIWHFDKDAEGWTGGTYNGGYINARTDKLQSPSMSEELDDGTVETLNTSAYHYIKMRLEVVGTPTWSGLVEWSGGSATITEPVIDEGVANISFDLKWSGSIDSFTIKIAETADNLNYYKVDWIAVGRPSPGASSAAVLDIRRAFSDYKVSSSERLTDLTSTIYGNNLTPLTASIREQLNTLASDSSTYAGKLSTLDAWYKGEDASMAAITKQQYEALTSADSANARKVDELFAEMDFGYADRTKFANINRSMQRTFAMSIAVADWNQSQRIDTLQSEFQGNSAQIQNELLTLASKDLSIASEQTRLSSKVDGNSTDILNLSLAVTRPESGLAAQVTQLQSQTEQATILAGNKGEIIYSYGEPPADKQLEQNLWFKKEGENTTPHVWDKDNDKWIALTDKAAADAQAEANAAKQAAGIAQSTAEDKGEVIFDDTAPEAAKQLVQNLWIDTAGDANTPKRWDGSAWVEVTDKATKDAASAASAAQGAAEAAQDAADDAAEAASDALDELDDISDDDKLTPSEKKQLRIIVDDIKQVDVDIRARADKYNVSVAEYNTAYTALVTNYINDLLAEHDVTSSIVRTEFNRKFNEFFAKRAQLDTSIAIAAKSVADGLKSDLSLGYASRNKYASKRTIPNNVATVIARAQVQANEANMAVIEAQDSAQNAQNAADDARLKANVAQGQVNDIAADSKLTPVEKKQVKLITDDIKQVDVDIKSRAAKYEVSTTEYGNAYTALVTNYINALLANPNATDDIDRNVFNERFNTFFTKRAQLDSAITVAAKKVADDAQQAASAAQGVANSALGAAQAAQGAADAAEGKAQEAKDDLSDIYADGKITPSEKRQIKTIWTEIVETDAVVRDNAAKYDVNLGTYPNAYTNLESLVDALLLDMNTTVNVNRTTLDGRFEIYYRRRAAVNRDIVTAAEKQAADAQSTANDKGEVITSDKIPDETKRQSQNLWIDTRQGKNTPRRWNGSAWEAVTDQAAIDAVDDVKLNLATYVKESGAYSTEFGNIAGEITTIQSTVEGVTDSIEVVAAIGDAERLKYEISKERLNKNKVALQGKVADLDSLIAKYKAQRTDAQAKKAEATDATVIAAYDAQIALLNTSITDTEAQRSEVASQVAQMEQEITELASLKQTESDIKKQYFVKFDSEDRAAGFGIMENADATIDFAVLADKFYIAAPPDKPNDVNGNSPFMVLTNQQTINGVTVPAGTYMRDFYAPRGSIDTLQVKDAAVDTLQIKSEAVTIPRLTYIGTPKIIVRDGVAQSGTTYSAIGNVPNPPFTPDSYTYDKWVFEVARTSFDPQGGSVSIELGVDGLHISKLKRVGAHFSESPFFFELQVRRLGTTNPLRVKREFRPNFTLNTAAFGNGGVPPFDIRLPTILDAPNESLGTVTYVAEIVFYAHRSTHATTRDFKRATEHEVGFSAAFCQILGVKR